MAIHFAGGTDRVRTGAGATPTTGCMVFRMKTTQATVNAVPISHWTSSSREGFGFILNNTANKMTVQCYQASGTPNPVFNQTGTTTVTDGVERHFAFNWNTANGSTQTLYINGVSEVSGAAGAAWPLNASTTQLWMGDNNDSFWPSFVGDLAEVALMFGRNLTVDEIIGLSKGGSPSSLGFTAANIFYFPFIRDAHNLYEGFLDQIGTTVSDHPRVIGL